MSEVKTDSSLPDWPWLYGEKKVLSRATCENAEDPDSAAHSYSQVTTRTTIDSEVYTIFKCRRCDQRMYRLKI